MPGFSEEAFDRYCQQACEARTAQVDEVAFARDVGAVEAPASGSSQEPAAPNGVAVKGFALEGKLQVGTKGASWSALEQVLGTQGQDTATPFECGSAFEAGNIRRLRLPRSGCRERRQHGGRAQHVAE